LFCFVFFFFGVVVVFFFVFVLSPSSPFVFSFCHLLEKKTQKTAVISSFSHKAPHSSLLFATHSERFTCALVTLIIGVLF
tara:strand:+ start:2863 stop:3102 length:240 start_codon:yes stop_codon:yes gene_type:complete